MRSIRGISIKRRLMLLLMASSCLMLVLATTAGFIHEVAGRRGRVASQLAAAADLAAAKSSLALAFRGAQEAQATLTEFAPQDDIIYACIYDGDRILFHEFLRGTNRNTLFAQKRLPLLSLSADSTLPLFENSHCLVLRPIEYRGDKVGTIGVCTTYNTEKRTLRAYGIW